jgi:hypothetical protein
MPSLQNVSAPIDNINVNMAFKDSPAIDAFGRLRQSFPYSIFDSKQIFDDQPLLWDDQETVGSEATDSVHSVNTASTTLSVNATTNCERTRQTFQRFNYQPGKSQTILMTAVMGTGGTGIEKTIGYIDDNNGLAFVQENGVVRTLVRTKTSGSPVDSKVSQTNWNIDVMDGTGPSGITADWSKAQVFIIDFEWLGVGRIRFGLIIDGMIYYNLALVYMSTPNLPLRFQISNNGTGAADNLIAICATIISEGGQENVGSLRYKSTQGTHVDADVANTVYAVVGIRLKSAYIYASINLISMSMITKTSDDFEWMIIFNPSVAGTFTYSSLTNSAIETAVGATANTVIGGTILAGGLQNGASGGAFLKHSLLGNIGLGTAIDGTVDIAVLCVRPLANNANIEGSLTWRELV